MNDIASIIDSLPDSDSVRRFAARLEQENPREFQKLSKNDGLLSDVLTLVAYSPLLAATLLQNPQYISWLGRKRSDSKIRDKEELLEALARFTLTNSQLETHVLLSRFQRRELLRIYLRDIRGLGTISEITEELSHLADAILEYALRVAKQELDNRYGTPQVKDEKGRDTPAKFSIVSLGKLGSHELNYASDIDLFFLYSQDGNTSGTGTRGAVSNKEYFIKLSELIARLVGKQAGEGASYRVDLRLRPHGRMGALAISLKEALAYYRSTARDWERQVLLRARNSAGDVELFKTFFTELVDVIYRENISLDKALADVRSSKLKIDQELKQERGFNAKLGRGGIREIEFIAQAPQLALGNSDPWLRASHTLISLDRLVDRGLLSKSELTQLSDAYTFLRSLEHRVQMENGLQTHAVPDDPEKQMLLARRMKFANEAEFSRALNAHTDKVSEVFQRLFQDVKDEALAVDPESSDAETIIHDIHLSHSPTAKKTGELDRTERNFIRILESREKSLPGENLKIEQLTTLHALCDLSDHFSDMLAANPALIDSLPALENDTDVGPEGFAIMLEKYVSAQKTFREEMAVLREQWAKIYLQIGVADLFEKITMQRSNALQTALAEASISVAMQIVERELIRKHKKLNGELAMAVFALGRLGGRGMDHGSDLDLVLVYDDALPSPVATITHREFYTQAAEIFTTVISSFTRRGNLYRVDLRLRPDGKNGALCSAASFLPEYLENRAAIWELLAYVKLRHICGGEFATRLEQHAKEIIHRKAAETDAEELREETLRVRLRLEQEKTRSLRPNEIHIKYSAGGLLDIYFLIRYLQLKNNVPEQGENRSTLPMLAILLQRGIITNEVHETLAAGYLFLRNLDHSLRLVAGRSVRLPSLGHPFLALVSARMKLDSPEALLENLTLHRVRVRELFEDLLKN